MRKLWTLLLIPVIWSCSEKNPAILEGLLGLTEPAPADFRLIQPDSNTVWRQGSTVSVRWIGSDRYQRVNINLYRGSRLFLPVAVNANNNGSFQWTIPLGLPNATDYYLIIYAVADTTARTPHDTPFSIYRSDQDFRILKPNGGESYHRGDTVSILWLGGTGGVTVRIDLYLGTAKVTTIADGAMNRGQYIWTIPNFLSDGDNYRLRLVCLETNEQDISDGVFSID